MTLVQATQRRCSSMGLFPDGLGKKSGAYSDSARPHCIAGQRDSRPNIHGKINTIDYGDACLFKTSGPTGLPIN